MNYTQTLEFLFQSLPVFETQGATAYKPGLERITAFCRHIGNPQRNFFTIHVAGTNGKGSVAHIIASVLQQAGYRTGLFTSPHLQDFRERIRVDGEMIPKQKVVNFVDKHHDKMVELELSFFEMTAAMAFDYFAQSDVEVAVIETGLGGRLDATNIIVPILSVITNIGLEHTSLLGDTLPKIAAEKAGIIKEGVPVIFDGRNPESREVILATAKEKHAPVWEYRQEMCKILDKTDKSIDFLLDCSYDEGNGSVLSITVPYLAEYQLVNSSLAVGAIHMIDPQHVIRDEVIAEGIRSTRWQGRMETVLPGVVLDGAHNADGIKEFIRTVVGVQEHRSVSLLFSAVVEKEYEKMIAEICESVHPTSIVVTQIDGARVVPAEVLSGVFRKYTDAEIFTEPDVEKAFTQALAKKGDGMLFCAGSLYLVGDIKAILQRKESNADRR